MAMQGASRQYVGRVWNFLIILCLVDVGTSAAVVTIVALVAAAFVAVGGSAVGLNLRHVRAAAAILGCIYTVVILIRTLWRHWQLVGVVVPEDRSTQQEVLQQDARPSTSPN
jgi:hypothetical protein